MSSSTAIDDLQERCAATMQPRERALQMPGDFYTDPAVLAREKERIFLRTWLCLGREEQVQQPGDYMSGELLGEPYVVSRDREGRLHAFVNMCLHRGVPVVQGTGNARAFSCPYHAWSYDLGGALVGSPHMGRSEVDLSHRRLRPLKLASWRGWIFASFDPEAEDFDAFMGPLQDDLWWFQSGQCRLAEKVVLRIDCNWKLLLENLIDIYHVPVLHRSSFGAFLKTARDKIEFKLMPRGAWMYEQEARPHAKDGQQLFPTLPWLEGQDSSTSMKAGIYPNLNLSLRFDSLRMWQVWPLTEATSELHMYSLFTPSAFEQPGFQKNYEDYKRFLLAAIIEEDGPMVVKLQQAMGSRFYVPGPFSHMEGAVHHLMRHYLETMTAAPHAAPPMERRA